MRKFNKFKTVFNIITDIWNNVSKWKNADFTELNEDEICADMIYDLQEVKNKYPDKRSGRLASEIATAILDYIFFEEDNKNAD